MAVTHASNMAAQIARLASEKDLGFPENFVAFIERTPTQLHA
jgi:hypothetical protein